MVNPANYNLFLALSMQTTQLPTYQPAASTVDGSGGHSCLVISKLLSFCSEELTNAE
jgi:hypothetical protein